MPDSTLKLLTEDDIRDLIVCDPITKKGKTALEHLGLANIITVDSYFGENDSSKSIYVSSKYDGNQVSCICTKCQEPFLHSHYNISQSEFEEKCQYLDNFMKRLQSDAPEESPLILLGTSGNGKSIFANRIIRYPLNGAVYNASYVYYDLDNAEQRFQMAEVFLPPQENNPLWLICILMLNKFRELLEEYAEVLPEIADKHTEFFVEHAYADAKEQRLFSQIKVYASTIPKPTNALFEAIVEQVDLESPQNTLERILEITMKLMYCANPSKKNYFVFDNIEHFIQMSHDDIYIPNKSLGILYQSIANVTANIIKPMESIPDNAWKVFKSILIYRRITLKIVTSKAHFTSMPHENEQDYTGYIDISKIWFRKKERIWVPYLQAKYNPTQSTRLIEILDDMMNDNEEKYGTSYQEMITPMMNGGIRRGAQTQAHAVMEVLKICQMTSESYINYTELQHLLSLSDATRYMYRRALLEIHYKWMIVSSPSKKRFERLNLGTLSDEKSSEYRDDHNLIIKQRRVEIPPAGKSTLVRRVLACLSHFPNTDYSSARKDTEFAMFSYIPLFDLMRVIFLNPNADNALNNKESIMNLNSDEHFIPLAEVLCSLANYDYWATRGGPMIVLDVDDSRMNYNSSQGLAQILEDIWKGKIQMTMVSKNDKYDEYSLRLTEIGKVFLDDVQPSFSFFAALFCSEEVPLFFLKDIQRIKFVITSVYNAAEKLRNVYINTTRNFCISSGTFGDLQKKYLPIHNGKCVSFCNRVKQMHVAHLQLFKDYFDTNATMLGIDNDSKQSTIQSIEHYISKYNAWKEEINCF